MDIKEAMMKELIHIRCLLEGIYLDSKEHKQGTQLNHVEERVKDELSEYKNKLTELVKEKWY